MSTHSQSQIVIKSNIFNALFLEFLKQFFLNLLTFLPLFGIYLLAEYIFDLEYQNIAIFSLLALTLLYSFYKISAHLMKIWMTKYIFTAHHLEERYGWFTIKSHSLNYSQITDIELTMTFWDNLCNVGNLIIHTANDTHVDKKTKASMVLKDIKNPTKLKNDMLNKISEARHHQMNNHNSHGHPNHPSNEHHS